MPDSELYAFAHTCAHALEHFTLLKLLGDFVLLVRARLAWAAWLHSWSDAHLLTPGGSCGLAHGGEQTTQPGRCVQVHRRDPGESWLAAAAAAAQRRCSVTTCVTPLPCATGTSAEAGVTGRRPPTARSR